MKNEATERDDEATLAQRAMSTAFRVALPSFEGPLDLLLHLIREHRIDIFDIPIALITEKYLEMLKAMKELDLDIAGEFLLMASTLAHIKSRLLLPEPDPVPDDEDQLDPRLELVRRLLDYQRYKAAAEELAERDLLDRVVFARRARLEETPLAEGELGLVEVSVFKLVEALATALRNVRRETPHQVFIDRITLTETITGLIERLKDRPSLSFKEALGEVRDRYQLVMTFLALLEMCKMQLIRVRQEEDGGEIQIAAREGLVLSDEAIEPFKDDYK